MRISDWSSDVCSSDLLQGQAGIFPVVPKGPPLVRDDPIADDRMQTARHLRAQPLRVELHLFDREELRNRRSKLFVHDLEQVRLYLPLGGRSDERRVGKECVGKSSTRWTP